MPTASIVHPLNEFTQLVQNSRVRGEISRASCCGSNLPDRASMKRTVTPWSRSINHGKISAGKSPSTTKTSSPGCHCIALASRSRPYVVLLPRMISSGAASISLPSAVLSLFGTSKKSSSRSRCGRAFRSSAALAASTATRGSGPWCAVFSQTRPSKGPKSSA